MSVPINREYTTTAKVLHWLVVILILWQFGSAWTWPTYPQDDPTRILIRTTHVYIGVAILVLAIVRVAWRLTHPAPPLPRDVPTLFQRLARLVQGLLYAMIFLQPISGLIYINTGDGALHNVADTFHGLGEQIIIILALLHVAGAIYHYFIRRDDVVQAMLPGRSG